MSGLVSGIGVFEIYRPKTLNFSFMAGRLSTHFCITQKGNDTEESYSPYVCLLHNISSVVFYVALCCNGRRPVSLRTLTLVQISSVVR